jgi:hypothetical protein
MSSPALDALRWELEATDAWGLWLGNLCARHRVVERVRPYVHVRSVGFEVGAAMKHKQAPPADLLPEQVARVEAAVRAVALERSQAPSKGTTS